ncbi:MAG: M20 family peptidase [Lysobacteraceae bacterium]|nr:MAG: M20 family peptidase [Xanthomonadaceae bacterium]
MNQERLRPALLLFVLTLLLPATSRAALDTAEQAMAATVTAEKERSIALLQRLVDQNSGTLNRAGVEAVGQQLRPELEALGFEVTWKPMADAGRAGHLIATHAGTPGRKRLLLIGHLDTVFEPDSPFQRFVRRDDIAEGPGVADNKGGLVVMLSALRAMHAAGTLAGANIEVVLSGDEEDAGAPYEVSRADLVAAGRRADVALDFEGLAREQGRDAGSTARRSSYDWTLTTTGRSGHSSGIFNELQGYGATYELARILDSFRRELPEPNLTFNVGLLGGGQSVEMDAGSARLAATGKSNIIASKAVARGDMRTLSLEQTNRVQAKMRAIVAEHLPGTGAEIDFEEGYPPVAPTAGNRALLMRLNAVNRDLGLDEMAELDPLQRGAGDIGFVAADVDSLIGLGIAGNRIHAPGETADLSSLVRQAQRAAILMSRLAQAPR